MMLFQTCFLSETPNTSLDESARLGGDLQAGLVNSEIESVADNQVNEVMPDHDTSVSAHDDVDVMLDKKIERVIDGADEPKIDESVKQHSEPEGLVVDHDLAASAAEIEELVKGSEDKPN